MRKTITVTLAVLGLLVAPAVFADTFTINDSVNEGVSGGAFIPAFVTVGGCDGTTCTAQANAALSAWLAGQWFNPKDGTNFIPPTGDHHRTGFRLMMTPTFSAGKWLTGFAPFLLNSGTAGSTQPATGISGPDGDNPISMGMFVDHPTDPWTAGKFPRYLPHHRDANWVDTYMVKYTASSAFVQSISIRAGFGQNPVTWSHVGGNWTCSWNGTTTTCSGTGNPGLAPPATSNLAPFVLDQRLEQSDTNLANALGTGQPVDLTALHGDDDNRQKFLSAITVVSGPNAEEETAADATSFVRCGSAAQVTADPDHFTDCNGKFAIRTDNFSLEATGRDGIFGTFDDPQHNYAARRGANGVLGAFNADGTVHPDGDDIGLVSCSATGGTPTNTHSGAAVASCNGFFVTLREGGDPLNETLLKDPILHAFAGVKRTADGSPSIINLVEQNVEGFLHSCMNCGNHSLVNVEAEPALNFTFGAAPTITGFSHPPQ